MAAYLCRKPGRYGVNFDPEEVNLSIGTELNKMVPVLEKGQPLEGSREKLKKIMTSSTIIVSLDLGMGTESAVGWGSDFSYEYVRINAEYTT